MRPKKILHLIQSLENGGCENMLLRMLPLLSGEFKHHIITLKNPGQLASSFIERNTPVSSANQKNILHPVGYRNLLSEVRGFSPDAIITYLFHADMIGRLFLGQKMTVPIVPFLRTTYNHPRYWIARTLEKFTKRLVPVYLANSEAVKNFYVSTIGVKPEEIIVIPNGIDTKYFDTLVPDPELRRSLNASPDDFIIISVANLHPNKGHRYLLEAFETVYRHQQASPERILSAKIKLLLVGDGTERRNLEQQIENYRSKKNISFLGRRTDVPQLLKISDCFILPTLFEGMSNAIMEGMAASLPVITTDIPENRELIENMKTGILVPTKDSGKISGFIRLLASNPKDRERLGEAAKSSIHKRFSLQVSSRMFADFLRSL